MCFLASRLSAYDFFMGSQQRDFQCGIVYSPEEAFTDPHFVAREFPVQVAHPELGRALRTPGHRSSQPPTGGVSAAGRRWSANTPKRCYGLARRKTAKYAGGCRASTWPG